MTDDFYKALEKLSTISTGGDFLPIENGFIYIFSVHPKDPELVTEEYQGKESTKFIWKIHYNTLKEAKDDVSKAELALLKAENEEKYNKIKDYPKNVDCDLKLAKTFSKQLAIYCLENEIADNTKLQMQRFGRSNKTKFNFELFVKK